jgi:5-methylcytosine-specific restriction endonuclease McrA
MQKPENELIFCACGCGGQRWRYGKEKPPKEHRYIHGHNTDKTKVQAFCDFCHESIEVPQYLFAKCKHHFCSHACAGKYKRGQIAVVCPQCGKSFTVIPARIEKATEPICCSVECLHARHTIETSCAQCGKPVHRGISNSHGYKHFFCSRECQHVYQGIHCRGPNHPRWLHGGPIDYGPAWPAAKRAALNRDRKTCQWCGSKEKGRLNVHHLRPFKTFTDPLDAHDLTNLITLCDSCHSKAEKISRELYRKTP